MSLITDYEARKARLQEQMRRVDGARLDKRTASNLFRVREDAGGKSLSVRDFNHVLEVNVDEGWVDVEGMTTYEEFVDGTLKYDCMPTVVPQLKTITIGGAVAGVGIEASSFRYGLVHETVLEMEILLASGEVVACNKNQNTDLFYGFPNSYGTLGYALRLKVKVAPVKPFVKIEHTRYSDIETYFRALEISCGRSSRNGLADRGAVSPAVDFVDGAMFAPTELYITTGTFVDEAPFVGDYTYKNIYYKSIRERDVDYLSVRDFIWRWDTDWFWCSKYFGAENPLIRRLFGRQRLNSAMYWKIRRFVERHPFILRIAGGFSRREQIIQDVDIPIDNAPSFARFFFQEINIRPVWICPFRAYDPTVTFDLYSFDPGKLYVNFGFWDSVATTHEEGFYNRMVEAKVSELHGKKGLYSDSFYTSEEFWKIYDKPMYDALKRKYDPAQKLKNLYEKCVGRR
jgi:FAD/FMN-containing dehydrogenase